MKFKVIGSNKDTAARMVLEFEAPSKAAAERKAIQQGMVVNSVHDITDGEPQHTSEPRRGRGQFDEPKSKVLPMLAVVIIVAAVVYFFLWGKIKAKLGM